jgi:hypothetical protein
LIEGLHQPDNDNHLDSGVFQHAGSREPPAICHLLSSAAANPSWLNLERPIGKNCGKTLSEIKVTV